MPRSSAGSSHGEFECGEPELRSQLVRDIDALLAPPDTSPALLAMGHESTAETLYSSNRLESSCHMPSTSPLDPSHFSAPGKASRSLELPPSLSRGSGSMETSSIAAGGAAFDSDTARAIHSSVAAMTADVSDVNVDDVLSHPCARVCFLLVDGLHRLRFAAVRDFPPGSPVVILFDGGAHVAAVEWCGPPPPSHTLSLDAAPFARSEPARKYSSRTYVAGVVVREASQDEMGVLSALGPFDNFALEFALSCGQPRLQLVAAKWRADLTKLTFYYRCDGRVDFTRLVHKLHRKFRARIWMTRLGGVVTDGTATMCVGPTASGMSGMHGPSSSSLGTPLLGTLSPGSPGITNVGVQGASFASRLASMATGRNALRGEVNQSLTSCHNGSSIHTGGGDSLTWTATGDGSVSTATPLCPGRYTSRGGFTPSVPYSDGGSGSIGFCSGGGAPAGGSTLPSSVAKGLGAESTESLRLGVGDGSSFRFDCAEGECKGFGGGGGGSTEPVRPDGRSISTSARVRGARTAQDPAQMGCRRKVGLEAPHRGLRSLVVPDPQPPSANGSRNGSAQSSPLLGRALEGLQWQQQLAQQHQQHYPPQSHQNFNFRRKDVEASRNLHSHLQAVLQSGQSGAYEDSRSKASKGSGKGSSMSPLTGEERRAQPFIRVVPPEKKATRGSQQASRPTQRSGTGLQHGLLQTRTERDPRSVQDAVDVQKVSQMQQQQDYDQNHDAQSQVHCRTPPLRQQRPAPPDQQHQSHEQAAHDVLMQLLASQPSLFGNGQTTEQVGRLLQLVGSMLPNSSGGSVSGDQ